MENVIDLKDNIQQIGKQLADANFGDVMVVGGGISGIQASLDLATAGFKVYLVEKAPSSAATWPSSIRPFRPTTARCEYSHPSWSRSAGIRTSRSSPIRKLRV